MPEKEYRPNLAEKLEVQALLWLEKHIEKAKPDPSYKIRRKFIKGGLAAAGMAGLGVGTGLVSSGHIEFKPSSVVSLPDLKETVPIARHHAVLCCNVQMLKGVGFLQQAENTDLDINEKAFLSWIEKTGEIKGVIPGIIFNSSGTFPDSIYHKNIWVPVDLRWQDYAHGKNEDELLHSLATDLSANVAVSVELIRQFGFDEAIRIVNDPLNGKRQYGNELMATYRKQFEEGQIPLFIIPRRVPEKWIEKKLAGR